MQFYGLWFLGYTIYFSVSGINTGVELPNLKMPIEQYFHGRKTSKIFRTTDSIDEWVYEEKNYWEEIISHFEGIHHNLLPNFRDLRGKLENIDHILHHDFVLINDSTYQPLINAIDDYASLGLPPANSQHGKHLLNVAAERPMVACAMISAWSPSFAKVQHIFQNLPNNREFPSFLELVEGIVEAKALDDGYLKNISRHDDALISLREKWEETNSTHNELIENLREEEIGHLRGQIKDLIRQKSELLSEFRKRASRRLRALRIVNRRIKHRYQYEMSLSEPVTYWRDKAAQHRLWAIIFTVCFGVFSVGSLLAFVFLLPELTPIWEKAAQSKGLNLAPIIMVGVPAFIIVWILRLIARNINTHTSQMHDARERSIMTLTFLSLNDQIQISSEERQMVLSALLRPSAVTSLDDGVPPSFFDIFKNERKK